MKDFTRILQDYCNANSISYHYGGKANLNLMLSDTIVGQIYIFQEIFEREPLINSTKTNYQNEKFVSKFFILVKSDLDQHYFNEKDGDETESKFTENIEPLRLVIKSLAKNMLCNGLDFNYKWIDVSDFFDANYDGILVTSNGTIYE